LSAKSVSWLDEVPWNGDGLVAVALVAQGMAASGGSLRALADTLPAYAMQKDKAERGETPWEQTSERLRQRFEGFALDTTDGLRFSRGDEWLHVRPSGTEPVVRFIAETRSAQRTRELIEDARSAVLPSTSRSS